MVSILGSLDALIRLAQPTPDVSAEQTGARLLLLWGKHRPCPASVSPGPASSAPHKEIMSSDMSLTAFPDSTMQCDGPSSSPRAGGSVATVSLVADHRMDSCGSSDRLFPLQ